MTDVFDEGLLRRTAEQVVTGFPPVVTENFAPHYDTPADLVDAMVRTGERVSRHMAKRDRGVPPKTYPLFALALLSMRTRPYDVQRNLGNVVTQYDRMVSWGDVPLDVAAQSRSIREDLADRLIAASRVARRVRDEKPDVVPFHIGMVTCAVLALLGDDVADPAGKVLTAMRRADLFAARHRALERVPEGRDPRFPVLGNADIVGQVAAYRVAVAELAGQVGDDQAVEDFAGQIATRLRRAMTKPFRHNDEPDSVLAIRDFARFVAADARGGGEEAAEIFQWLHPELTGLSATGKPPIPVGDEVHDMMAGPEPNESTVDSQHIANWVLAELYTGATRSDRAVLDDWLTGRRRPDHQDDMLFLVDRLRRVDRRLYRLPLKPPETATHAGATEALVRSRIEDAVTLQLDGREIGQHVLPPLWTDRGPVVELVDSKLRLLFKPGATMRAKATLLAKVVVRGPAHQVHRAVSAVCACDGEAGKVSPAVVCPHRPWTDAGRVENYTTLTMAAGLSNEAATAQQVKRYDGYWTEWMHEVRDERQ